MSKNKWVGLVILFNLLLSPQVFCNTLLSLKLLNIKADEIPDKSTDNIYFSLTHYSNKGKAETLREPIYPTHWSSSNLTLLKNKLLWESSIQEGEEIKLIISLLKQNSAPWETDTLLGSAKVVLSKHKQDEIIKKQWGKTSFFEQPDVIMKKKGRGQIYQFKSEGRIYTLNFLISEKVQKDN
ncbi:MAG: hypothetical protein JWM09_465 [Francisellaceae bacterium]|nr:hypothetical protein [Francisellaceae bacterium]